MGFIECYYRTEHKNFQIRLGIFAKSGIALKRDIAHSLYQRLKNTHTHSCARILDYLKCSIALLRLAYIYRRWFLTWAGQNI